MELNRELLQELELTLDPYHPEDGAVPIEILGFGEISLVFKITDDPAGDIAYKRLPIFDSVEQVENHIKAYRRYNQVLSDIGITLPESDATWVYADEKQKNITLFCAQTIIPSDQVCNKLLHKYDDDQIFDVYEKILHELLLIWEYNATSDEIKLGFDGQISNFASVDHKLYYLDTSTPMYRIDGEDAMEGTLFLKSAPPGVRFLLKIFFLQEILDRYYHFRDVLIDLMANFYKEQRGELVPELVENTNEFLKNLPSVIESIDPLTVDEIESYYREDKFIWSLFQKVRSIHRFITTKILRRKYPFYLPGKIDR